ncbi:hypothetical protein [Planococcus sp. YIM B11945]|uniref:hypothetical protein n=1 Tax=Planococcus sp. YIM B11945 TaxID=3435410 RepID=UPI003D7DF6B3
MKENPRQIGDKHVKEVYLALKKYVNKEDLGFCTEAVHKTATYIIDCYPNIKCVFSKFDFSKTEKEDLLLVLEDGSKIRVNLFLIKKGGRIQPKNLGAKSFLEKYFLQEKLQDHFNAKFEEAYNRFLKRLYEEKYGFPYLGDQKELKKIIKEKFQSFTPEINPMRDEFLYSLREECFALLTDFYNGKNQEFLHAYNTLLMVGDFNVITVYGKGGSAQIETFEAKKPSFDDIQIYKTGKSTVGIRCGEIGLTLRFKFESRPSSSIKLATSYEYFTEENSFKNKNENEITLRKVEELMHNHNFEKAKNTSNAIGKCHEAITYYYFLSEYPNILQVETDKCIDLLSQYSSLIDPELLGMLFQSTSTIVPAIRERLSAKYKNYEIESIELIPESYIVDRLNTGDIQLVLRINGKYLTEDISLKAIAKKSGKITTKNPGVGTILGPIYFNLGSMDSIVSETKSHYESGAIGRREVLENLSEELGAKLQEASQEKLKKGIESLIGKALMAITYYKEKASICKKPSEINGEINVYVKSPSPIQNTLSWNENLEMLNLRMKFSKGEEHGWSSVKLTSEYQIK